MKLLPTTTTLLLTGILLLASCNPKSGAAGTKVKQPFTGGKYESNAAWFRGTGQGPSVNQNIAKGKADIEAKNQLSGQVGVNMRSVTDQYLGQTENANAADVADKFQSLVRGVMNNELADLRKIGEVTYFNEIGHSSYLNYGKWDLGFTLRAYLGNYVYNNVASANGFYDQLAQASPYNLHTSVLETNFVTNQKYSDYYVERASFLRMDNITVGYAFNLRGQAARAFATMQNAFTITGYSGVDPTAGLNGIDNNLYPRSRTFTGGMGIRF